MNAAAGVVVMLDSQPFGVIGFTVSHGKVVEVNGILDPERIRELDLSVLD